MELTMWSNETRDNGILLGSIYDNVLHVEKDGDKIHFTEWCDGFYSKTYTKEQALKVVDELRAWIEAQQ